MRDANVHTLHAENQSTIMPRRVEVTSANAIVRVLTSASCDLAPEFRRRYQVGVLPQTVKLGRGDLLDRGNEAETKQIYAANLLQRVAANSSVVPTVNDIRDAITERIEHEWTHAILIVPSLKHTRFFDNAVQAAQHVSVVINRLRKSSVVPLPFQLAVIDSGTICAGAGLLAFDAVARSHVGMYGDRLTHHLEGMRKLVHTFVAVRHLSSLSADPDQLTAQPWNFGARFFSTFGFRPVIYVNAGRAVTVKRVRTHQAQMNLVLAKCIEGIEAGLKTPGICISYAGPMNDLESLPSWKPLLELAKVKRIRILPMQMSLSEAARLGSRALCAAFASSVFRP